MMPKFKYATPEDAYKRIAEVKRKAEIRRKAEQRRVLEDIWAKVKAKKAPVQLSLFDLEQIA